MRTTFEAIVEVATTDRVDEAALETTLAEYSPRVSTSEHGWFEIRLSVAAVDLSHACHTAIAVATAITGGAPLACEVMTTQESEERHSVSAPSPGQTNGASRRDHSSQPLGRAARA